MNPIEVLLAQNDIDGAIALLEKTDGVDKTHLILCATSQWSQLTQHLTKGLLGVGDSDYKRSVGQIKYNLLEMAKKVKNWPASSPSPAQPSPSMNKVATVKNVFKAIREDLENLAYAKNTILGYISSLNAAFESKIFSAFGDTLTISDWEDLNSAQQKERCKKVLENLSSKEDQIVTRMIDFQSKLNGIVSLDESIQNFFNRPTVKSWNELSEQLASRFADTSLFGERVIHAFNDWKQKINNIANDDLSFSMDFNFDFRADFGAFLQTNLSPKNFNYA